MLKWAITESPGHWPVVGITDAALQRFADYDFRRVAGMKIHRAHLRDCKDWQSMMLMEKMPFDAWRNLYMESDRTVLATSSENLRGGQLQFIPIPQELGFFRSTGYNWRHTLAERDYLRSLYSLRFGHAPEQGLVKSDGAGPHQAGATLTI
jgi:hypothetical protein